MEMTPERFDALVKRLEELAARRPGTYKLRVFLLALLGYLYIFSVIAVLLVLSGFLLRAMLSGGVGLNWLVIKLSIGLLALGGIILRALWVRMAPPEGLRLERKDEETLFAMIDSIQETLKAPRVHEILLTDDFNASVSQVPRLGILGWHKNYLALGLPLMQALPPKQFRAVLAHEFGHLSGAHGRFSSWIYRVRVSWYRLMTQLDAREHWGAIVFARFFQWYAPYFEAYSFVLARAQEYEADRLAAEIAGSKEMADTLVNLEISRAYFQEAFWPSLYQRANTEAQPSSAPFTEMQIDLHSGWRPEQARKWLRWALALQTDNLDTHPSLSARLSALGQEARLPACVKESAAEYFMKNSLVRLTACLNSKWKAGMIDAWKERYKHAQQSRQHLLELERKARSGPLTLEDAWQRATLTEELYESQAALPLFQQVLDLKPDHAGALFSGGRILLSRDQAGGIDYIKNAMRLDNEHALNGYYLVCAFLIGNGRADEAKAFYDSSKGEPSELSRAG
jgi:Zn-dependent protease with chaperone function